MKTIHLQFGKTVTRLADNQYGRQVYNEQVRNQIDFSTQTQIVFPEQIVNIASSFVQGFFHEIIKNVGILGIGTQILVVAPSINIEEKIMNNLLDVYD